MTTTVNTVFGSGVVSESTGIIFNNQMDDFSSPGRSSLVTPHPSPANFPAPGKRPLSAMSPMFAAERGGKRRLVAAAGGSGGPLIVSATLQTMARCAACLSVLGVSCVFYFSPRLPPHS
jgi:gamma-glutamyltranspeptidase